jgi:IS30 family transposase
MAHLTCEQRYVVGQMHNKGFHYSDIASMIEVHPSTVLRELRRNGSDSGYYSYRKAQMKYEERRAKCARRRKITPDVEHYILDRLEAGWSPEQIAGRACKDGLFHISFQAIYRFINCNLPGYRYFFRFRGRKRKHGSAKCLIKNKIGINERPKAADDRTEFGHFEADTVVSKGRDFYFVTLNERKTGFGLLSGIPNKNGIVTAITIVSMLRSFVPFVRSITSDNGTEFSEHETVARELGVSFYFARPYCSNDRASNENFNGLVRYYFPKKESFMDANMDIVSSVQDSLNDRPRKRLNWITPREAYLEEIRTYQQ